MLDLSGLQKEFQQFILGRPSNIENEISAQGNVSTMTRLDIYRDGYYLRIIEALQQDYAVLAHLLGEKAFNNLCFHYIQNNPSPFRSLRWYGKTLASEMRQMGDYEDKAYLIEMAEFEWYLTEAFDEKEAPLVTLEEISQIAPDDWVNMRFQLHPSIRQIELDWNVGPLWQSFSQNEGNQMMPTRMEERGTWIIWRKEEEVHFCSLTRDEVYMLNAMKSGHAFYQICEGLSGRFPEETVALNVATLLKRYILDQLIIKVTVG